MTLLANRMKTETEKLREWMHDQELCALALLHETVVEMALNGFPDACDALKKLAQRYPEVVEELFARAANDYTKRRMKHVHPQQIR